LLSKTSSIPVWISDAEFSGGYDIYCHQVLWPSLHYFLHDRPKSTSRDESNSVAQYKTINERFAEKIVEVYEPGDISKPPRLWCE
jgi:trehalose-6-phosphate synthase